MKLSCASLYAWNTLQPGALARCIRCSEPDRRGVYPVSRTFTWNLVLAEKDGQATGYAVFFTSYSTWTDSGLFLEDLFVRENFRGHGVGKALLFWPRSRERRLMLGKLRPLMVGSCPFVNLPETHKGRWGDGLTAEDMKKCVWVKPEVVARIEYLEWTDGDHLRHSKFVGLREDKDAGGVTKEHAGI